MSSYVASIDLPRLMGKFAQNGEIGTWKILIEPPK